MPEPMSSDLPTSRAEMKIADLLDNLRRAAARIENEAKRRAEAQGAKEIEPVLERQVRAIDLSHDLLEKILPHWPEVVSLIKRRSWRR